jgi:uncharacterized phage protein (TIGR02218 family)
MPDGTFGQYEVTRQGAQPVDLYHFFHGNASVAGTSALPPSVEVVAAGPCSGTPADLTWTPTTTYASGGSVTADGVAVVPGVVATDYGMEATVAFSVTPGTAQVGVLARYQETGTDDTHLRLAYSADYLGDPSLVLFSTKGDAPAQNVGQEISSVVVANPGVGSHTIRLDVIGTQAFGYLDGDLLITAVFDDFQFIQLDDVGLPSGPVHELSRAGYWDTGDPGYFIDLDGPGTVAISAWRVGTPGNIPTPSAGGNRTLLARDGFDGSNVTDITGRALDGGGTASAAVGAWAKGSVSASTDFNISIISNTAHFTSVNTTPVGNRALRLVTGITGLTDDHSVELVWRHDLNHVNQGVNGDHFRLYARQSTVADTGYQLRMDISTPNAFGADPVSLGGIEWDLFKVVAGSGTRLAWADDYTGGIDIGVDHTLTLCVTGGVISGYLDGNLVLTAVDGSPLTGGVPGFAMADTWLVSPLPAHADGTTYTVKTFSVYGDIGAEPEDPPVEVDTTPLLELNYTSADVEITYQGDLYVPFIAHRTEFKSGSGERTASEIDLSLPFDHPVSTLCMGNPGMTPIGCIVYRLDRQDTTDGAAAIPLQGQVTRHRIEGRWCVITLGNVGTLLTRKLPRMLTQRTCPHVLGGPFCQLNLTAFTHTGLTVSAVSGRQVTVSGANAIAGTDVHYFQEGVLRTADGRSMFIEAFDAGTVADQLTLKERLDGLEENDVVTLVAGCDHQATTCDTRFANIEKFGGETGMPDRNPFTGGGLV